MGLANFTLAKSDRQTHEAAHECDKSICERRISASDLVSKAIILTADAGMNVNQCLLNISLSHSMNQTKKYVRTRHN